MKKIFKLFWQAVSGKEEEYTSGSINKAIFLLAVPMVLEMVMESTFAIVDIFFVAKIGTDAIATIGLTEVVLMIIESVAVGIAMAATAMVARRVGEGQREEASLASAQIILLAAIVSTFFGALTFAFAGDILRLMGGSEQLVAQGTSYTRIVLGFNGTLFFLFVLNAIFRGAGNAAIAMRTLWIANGINIILDPCLIFGWGPFPELGLTGAAVATTIGRGTGVLYQLYYLLNGKSVIALARKHFYWVGSLIVRLIRVSLGGIGQFLISTASWLFLVRIMAEFGSDSLAAYTIAIRIIIFTLLPAWGLGNAAATLVGQNLGAGNPERAEKSVWKAAIYNMVFLFVVGVLYFLTAENIVQWFTQEPVVVAECTKGLKIISLGYVFYACGMVLSQSFNGAGDTVTPTLLNFIAFWIIQIPLAYFLTRIDAIQSMGIYYAIAISNSVLAMMAFVVFRRGKWKLIKI